MQWVMRAHPLMPSALLPGANAHCRVVADPLAWLQFSVALVCEPLSFALTLESVHAGDCHAEVRLQGRRHRAVLVSAGRGCVEAQAPEQRCCALTRPPPAAA